MAGNNTIGGERICSNCIKWKPLSEFGVRRWKSKSRYRTYCKDCESSKSLKWKHINKTLNVAISRRTRLKRVYGITEADYAAMVEKQGGKCALCGSISDIRLDVDHNHETGKVRGLLCRRCNIGLGQWDDNPELLRKAIEYLLSH